MVTNYTLNQQLATKDEQITQLRTRVAELECAATPHTDAFFANKEIARLRAALEGIAMITDSAAILFKDEVYRKAKQALGETK